MKEAWVTIHRDALNPQRRTREWNTRPKPQEPWNDDIPPLETYTYHFNSNEPLRRALMEKIAEVQAKYRVFWEEEDRSVQLQAEKESDAQKQLRDQAFEDIKKIPDFFAPDYRDMFTEEPWPQADTYWHRVS
ncbi:MAG: hypothetical protein Q9183_003258 [Haloplaca sp. 2 TL-2023]